MIKRIVLIYLLLNSIMAIAVNKKVLVIRANAPDSNTTRSVTQLRDDVFGSNGDTVNLKTQIEACSYNQITIEPLSGVFNGHHIVGGVAEVDLSVHLTPGNYHYTTSLMMNAADDKYALFSCWSPLRRLGAA